MMNRITPPEYQELLSQTPGFQGRLLLQLMYSTGARLGEIIDITPNDFWFLRDDVVIIKIDSISGKIPARTVPVVGDFKIVKNLFENGFINTRIFTEFSSREKAFKWVKELGKSTLNRELVPHQFRRQFAEDLPDSPEWVRPFLLGHKFIYSRSSEKTQEAE